MFVLEFQVILRAEHFPPTTELTPSPEGSPLPQAGCRLRRSKKVAPGATCPAGAIPSSALTCLFAQLRGCRSTRRRRTSSLTTFSRQDHRYVREVPLPDGSQLVLYAKRLFAGGYPRVMFAAWNLRATAIRGRGNRAIRRIRGQRLRTRPCCAPSARFWRCVCTTGPVRRVSRGNP